MLFGPKEIALKDGRRAIFRNPVREDAIAMLDCMRDCFCETEFLVNYPEEWTMGAEEEIAYLENLRSSDSSLMIVCEVDGEIAGNCSISFYKKIKTKHRATIGIALRKKYWNLGIGTAMFREMIAVGAERGVMQLELSYTEGNERGRRLYEKMGFIETGVRPDAFRFKDGTLHNEIFMARKV